mgnify:CR=1 FL=1
MTVRKAKARSGRIEVRANRNVEPRIAPKGKLNFDATRLFTRVAEETLHGDRETFDKLTPHERSIVIQWMSDAYVTGQADNLIHDVLWEVDFVRKPIGIEEFMHDDFYFGKIAGELHPKWKDDLRRVFAPNSGIFEWILTGAIGIGKTTLAGIGVAYKLYLMSCLRNPAAYYGLLPGSQIIFGVYSITKRQVADTGYNNIRGYIDTSPYFRTLFPRSTKIDSQLDFEPRTRKRIKVIPGSTELHALGLNLFAFLMDEVNFMHAKDDRDKGVFTGQAYKLYNATYTRMLSRFTRVGGTLPGMMFLLSSRNAQTSFLEEHLKTVQSGEHRASTFVSDYPLWEVKNKTFTWPGFKVEVGDRVSKSRLLQPNEQPRQGSRIVEVPWEYRRPFTEDIDQALRDIAGVATFNLAPLVSDRPSIFDAVSPDMQHPFTREEVVVSIADDVRIETHFKKKTACRIVGSTWVPRINPKCPRFMHIDIGLTNDALGIAMGHVAGIQSNTYIDAEGVPSSVRNPVVVMDFMLRVVAPSGGEVDLSKIRSFISFLSTIYSIYTITFDRFQSADSIQILTKQGFNVRHLSVDRDEEPYLALRSAFFDRRVLTYQYTWFIDEVLDLQRDAKKHKIDHPVKASVGNRRGSKDVADAVAGVIHLCMNDPKALHKSVSGVEFGVRANAESKAAPTLERVAASGDTVPAKRNESSSRIDWEALRRNL